MQNDSGASSENDNSAPDSRISTKTSISYWNSVSADVDGMLGGYPQVSRIDLQGSKNFVSKLRRLDDKSTSPSASKGKLSLGVDCGAGIGRITEGLLTHLCEVVDIVEPIQKFADVLQTSQLKTTGSVGDIFVIGLESWRPSKKYDLIWNQWCLGHLTDTQLIDYLQRAGQSLTENGWVIVKENLNTQRFGQDLYDEIDSSVTRSDRSFRDIFEKAGLTMVKAELQTGFPKGLGLYPVKMYALRPK